MDFKNKINEKYIKQINNIIISRINKLIPNTINTYNGIKKDIPPTQIICRKYFDSDKDIAVTWSKGIRYITKVFFKLTLLPQFRFEYDYMDCKKQFLQWKIFSKTIIDLNNLKILKKGFPIDKLYSIRLCIAEMEYGFVNKKNLIDCGDHYICNICESNENDNNSTLLQWFALYHTGGFILYFHSDTKNEDINISAEISIIDIPETSESNNNDKIIQFKTYPDKINFRQNYGIIFPTMLYDYTKYTYIGKNPKNKMIEIEKDYNTNIEYLVDENRNRIGIFKYKFNVINNEIMVIYDPL